MSNPRKRRQLAEDAARILLEEGVVDYGLAKRKAAQQAGIDPRQDLPTNREIETALLERHRLFATDATQEEVCRRLRIALQVMEVLDFLQPRLVGPLVQGIVEQQPDIRLHAFAETVEEVILELAERRIACRSGERRYRGTHADLRVPYLRFTGPENTRIEMTVFPQDGIRQAPPSPVDGRPMRRLSLAEVKTLLDSQRAESKPGPSALRGETLEEASGEVLGQARGDARAEDHGQAHGDARAEAGGDARRVACVEPREEASQERGRGSAVE